MSSSAKTPKLEARTSKALPAAGAWDPEPLELPCGWASSGTLYVVQVQDGAASASQWRAEVSPDGAESASPVWYPLAFEDTANAAVGADGFEVPTNTWIRQLPAATVARAYPLPPRCLAGSFQVRISFSEYGEVANPCVVAAHLVLYREGE